MKLSRSDAISMLLRSSIVVHPWWRDDERRDLRTHFMRSRRGSPCARYILFGRVQLPARTPIVVECSMSFAFSSQRSVVGIRHRDSKHTSCVEHVLGNLELVVEAPPRPSDYEGYIAGYFQVAGRLCPELDLWHASLRTTALLQMSLRCHNKTPGAQLGIFAVY